MDIKPIKDEASHQAALAEIEVLMSAKPDTRSATWVHISGRRTVCMKSLRASGL
jgi:hypothetical protein|nr:hypothetical protein [Variovorax soli]